MNAILLALTLALAATVQADKCMQADAGFQVKTNILGVLCMGGDTTTCTASGCDCVSCCEAKNGTCQKVGLDRGARGVACGMSTHEFDRSKSGTLATDRNYMEKCCKKIVPTCKSKRRAAALLSSTTCDTDTQVVPAAKEETTVADDLSDYVAKCCATKKTCASLTCPAGYTDKAGKNTTKCSSDPCSPDDCCDTDPLKCRGVQAAGSKCNSNMFADKTKYGNAATSSNYNTTCCTVKATCEAFKKAATVATTSAAMQQHKIASSLLFAVVGGFASGKGL